MQAGLNKRELHRLAHAFILLKNDRMCLDFLEDICTPNELKALSQRLEVAVRLHRGENYAKIVNDTGASKYDGFPCQPLFKLWSRGISKSDSHAP